MSGFKALNLESDDESDIEVDDTKELQIEDALKLYQTALKYHADGPESFDQAAAAYEELFRSEIFQYPESQTELRRIELYGALPETEDIWEDGAQAGVVVGGGGLDSGPSTLPQILHLSHKNYAQFKLEYLDARLQYLNYTLNQILKDASDALDHFVSALDKDDSDLDLWRRTAAVGEILDSKRVARFCLEAVLDGDDEGLGSVLALPGLDEGLAAEQLRCVVGAIEDELSALQAPLPVGKKRALSKLLKQRLNSYEDIDTRQKLLRDEEGPPTRTVAPDRVVMKCPKTWADLGNALLERQKDEQNGAGPMVAGVAISFDPSSMAELPGMPVDEPVEQSIRDGPLMMPALASGQQTVAEQFPGLDKGQPTVQPQMNSSNDTPRDGVNAADLDMDEATTISLPTRKRSVDAAGLGDATEEGRTKSKRTRTRESGVGEDSRQSLEEANRRWEQEQKLGELQAADDWMFETVGNLFERIGVVGFEASKNVRQELQSSDSESDSATEGDQTPGHGLQVARSDLHFFLHNFSSKLAQTLTAAGDELDAPQTSGTPGFSGSTKAAGGSKALARKVPPMPDDGLYEMLEDVYQNRLLLEETACAWISRLLRSSSVEGDGSANSYSEYQWSEELKTMVVRVLVNFDEPLVKSAAADLEGIKWAESASEQGNSLAMMLQTIFELHLDVYCLIKQPNSGVDLETIASQKDRLARWSELAREAMSLRSQNMTEGFDAKDELNLRFLWATTFHIGASDDISQEYVIDTMQDLRAAFVNADDTTIQLQNNAVMPELSTAALDREISRLTTKDFFLKVTKQDVSDPVAVIESLEPLLAALDEEGQHETADEGTPLSDATVPASAVSPDLVAFLRSSDSSIRLMLWLRLRDAYLAIDYKPMVVSCYFKILRMTLKELSTSMSGVSSQADRQVTVFRTLRQARIVVKKVLDVLQSSETAFECIDEDGLKSAVSSLGEVLQLTQVFNIFEDSVRVEQTEAPKEANGSESSAFKAVTKATHEMQVHIWIVLYRLFEEAIFQFHDLFDTPAEDRFEFLRTIHRNLGLRHICGDSNRAFVQLLKNEFFQMTHIDGYDSEQSQVLYDLYGINCFLNPSYELIEHDCTRDAFLDRGVAMQAVDLLIQQASKLPMKELAKHTLKDTIDKVHGSTPRKKPTDAILRNRELYRTFLRSPINPLDLYSCLKGEGNQLDVSPIPKEDALLASKGWYFLMGHTALAKFRSIKRTGPTSTEDIDIAIAFFNQELEYSGDNWETWFRLAQAYDTKIEESVVWSAEKLNSSMSDIVQLQRAAIHCYTMATALAYRSADLRFETSEKMTELLTDFAMRMYASSREPFGMKPFELDDADKFLSYRQGVARGKPFQPLRPFTAWKLSKTLFQRALAGKPQSWHLHYMLGKCLWKMHTATNLGSRDSRPDAQQVLTSFIHAVEFIPDSNKKDSREKREPVLEPHYKLVSVVHKLVSKGHIGIEEAKEALSNTSYARTATSPKDQDEWVPHILAVLKNLRAADKSNWHHRMIARAARIVYEDADPRAGDAGGTNNLGAMGAKHELTQQMFTKTMVLQVWRPECERAGRHFVYTARYTRFFVRILEQLKDRASLEALARRVRRRPHDVFEHAFVWQDICNAYLRLLRAHASLAEGLETSTFSNIAHEDFLARKEPLEKWMQAQETGTSPALDVLREVQELKKINQSLMKPGPIDDLIGDSYAFLFNTIGKQLWDDERRIKQEEEARRPPPAASPTRNPMMSLTHLMNVDGASDQPPPPPAAAPSAQPPAEPSVRRKIGVGRREIRTTAESCFQKAKAAPPALTGHEITYKGPLPRVQVVIDNNRVERLGDMSVDSSAPGSIHDSADDESELSELEEEGDEEGGDGDGKSDGEEKPRLLFPGLVSEAQSRQDSEGVETAEEGPREGEEQGKTGGEDVEMAEGGESDAAEGAAKMVD